MKAILFLVAACLLAYGTSAQTDSTLITEPLQIEVPDEEFQVLIDSINVPAEMDSIEIQGEKKDTVHIRVGKHAVEIVSGGTNTYIDIEKIDDFESKWDKKKKENNEPDIIFREKAQKKKRSKFDGHWSGWDFGGNQLWDADYSMYPTGTPAFMATMPEKSFEVNLNFAEYSFGFSSYVGIVTGLGFNFNDYKFKNRYTIVKDANGIIQPQDLPEGDFRKTKISTVYLHAPLLLEFQIPGQYDHKRMFIAGGVIGGLKLSEHTKYKIGDQKFKDKGNHNVAPVRWGYTAKIGFEDMGIFGTYYNTKFFETGTGPELTPWTVGLTFSF